jgi:hypothetical protein
VALLLLGGFGGEGLYLVYYPLLTKALAAAKTLPLPTQKLHFRSGFARLGKIYRRWVVLFVLPIGGNFVSRSKDLIKSIFICS